VIFTLVNIEVSQEKVKVSWWTLKVQSSKDPGNKIEKTVRVDLLMVRAEMFILENISKEKDLSRDVNCLRP
jgi:hypothetical protein